MNAKLNLHLKRRTCQCYSKRFVFQTDLLVCSGIEGLCILLKRLNYPCRYSDMIHGFARPVPELCMLTNTVLDWVYATHGERLTSWNQPFLSRECLESYARTISEKGAPLTICFGFVDETVRQICRPGKNQQVVYNGHKRVHALKFQAVALCNEIVANLFGPVEGRHHDAGILTDFGVLVRLVMFYAFMGTKHIHYTHG